MRDYGTGTIERTGDGRFRPRLPRAFGRKRLEACDTEGEARALLAVELQALADDPPEALRLGEWGEAWIDARERSGLYRSTKRERKRWRRHVKDAPLGRRALRRIAPTDVRAFLRSLSGAPKTKRNIMTLVRGALREAVEAGHIAADPSHGVTLPRSAKAIEEWTWLSMEEVSALLKASAEWQRSIFAVAIFTGLRAGELWGLKWEDVGSEIHVRRAVTEDGKLGPPKSGKPRHVPLLAPAAVALPPRGADGDFVFPGRWGNNHPRGYNAQIKRALKAAKIERRVRFHDLRHTCASHLIQGTWAPHFTERAMRLEDVQLWLGHSTRTITERYAHLSADSIRSVVVDHKRPTTTLPALLSLVTPRGLEAHGSLPHTPGESEALPEVGRSLGRLAREALDAIAEREPWAIQRAIDLAEAVLAEEERRERQAI